MGGEIPPHFARIDAYVYYYNQKMYVRGPQHSITGGDPPQYIQVGGETLPESTPMTVFQLYICFSVEISYLRSFAQTLKQTS